MSYTNKLINEKSPYLLQHAYNPVDWFPWSDAAFEKARKEDKPVLLSIGYSTCHWCHVMEEESFSNPQTAALMNEHFVSIKVDREERPDIDQVYMSYVIATTGGGGWPMTVFLSPDKKPFYGGTYFPPENRPGLQGFSNLLLLISDAWKNRRSEILASADSAAGYLKSHFEAGESKTLGVEILNAAFQDYEKNYDREWGGFGRAPKFPMGHSLSFLLRYGFKTQNRFAFEMAQKSLSLMAQGTLFDALGGGFHRYATDRKWRLPHFEKMLYDQALLSKAYLEAYQVDRSQDFRRTAEKTLDYVLREMQSPEGGFFSAQDADSPDPANPSKKREGAYYVWTNTEVRTALPQNLADIFCFHYGVTAGGNVSEDPHGEFISKNALFENHSLRETAEEFKLSPDETEGFLDNARRLLLEQRGKRPAPYLDDKILTDWNGLMISSLAFGSLVLKEPRYAKAAAKAAEFVLDHLKNEQGMLLHRYRDGISGIEGTLDDYAFLSLGLLDLYEATLDARWLKEADRLVGKMQDLFWDKENGGFYLTSVATQDLIARPKTGYDGALPSGNSVAALVLLKTGRIKADESLLRQARDLFGHFSQSIGAQPTGHAQMLIAMDFDFGPSYQVVVVGGKDKKSAKALLDEIYLRFIPNKIILFSSQENGAKDLQGLTPLVRDKVSPDEKPIAYLCQDYTCQLPVTDLGTWRKQLDCIGKRS